MVVAKGTMCVWFAFEEGFLDRVLEAIWGGWDGGRPSGWSIFGRLFCSVLFCF